MSDCKTFMNTDLKTQTFDMDTFSIFPWDFDWSCAVATTGSFHTVPLL